jgi:type II secretory pathway predicted ATPase ExeA
MSVEEADWKLAMQFWGTTDVPFAEGYGSAPYITAPVEAAFGLLRQTAALRSVSLLTGEPGVGKSSVAAWWSAQLEPKQYRPLIVTHSLLSGGGLLAMLLHKFGKEAKQRRDANLKLLETAAAELGRITPVLILDEAQNYHRSALEEIRLLLGLNLSRQPLFGLVLIGDGYLIDILRLQSYRSLYTRISMHVALPRLNREQVEPYLAHGLRAAGLSRSVFTPASVEMLSEATDGLPRTLNFLARSAWCEAARRRANEILPEHVSPALRLIPAAHDKIASA